MQTHPDGKNGFQTEEQEYALFVVNRMSLGAFEREQREYTIRYVSDKLLEETSVPGNSQYMALLVRSLDYPKKSMHLVSQTVFSKNMTADCKKLSDPTYLWNLADQIDSGSEKPVSSSVLIAFRQLATKAIR